MKNLTRSWLRSCRRSQRASLEERVEDRGTVGGEGGWGLVGPGDPGWEGGPPYRSVVAEVGGVVVVAPVVGGEGVAGTDGDTALSASGQERVGLPPEVQQVAGETGVKERPEVLLLSWKRGENGDIRFNTN